MVLVLDRVPVSRSSRFGPRYISSDNERSHARDLVDDRRRQSGTDIEPEEMTRHSRISRLWSHRDCGWCVGSFTVCESRYKEFVHLSNFGSSGFPLLTHFVCVKGECSLPRVR